MKKIGFFAAIMAIAFSHTATAQNEVISVFRNDKTFNSFKSRAISGLTHSAANGGFDNLIVTDSVGKTTTISLSAIDSVKISLTDLPEFHVNLTDYPDWTELKGLKTDVHPATLRMDGNGMYADLPEQTVEFRGRGNSTWNMKKKPYRFKMAKKDKVCGLRKAKTFALIANYIDCSLMRNTVALWTANYLGMPYANHCVPVKVYFNGIFKGAYMLTEKIGIGGGSVDIDEYKGILFEIDTNYDEDFKFQFQSGSVRLPVMVKDPDFTEICDSLGVTTGAYLSKWQSDFTTMARAVVNGSSNIADYIDLEQAAKFFIVNSLAANHEMEHPKSLYIHKDSIGGLYKFGPVWDFDWAFTFDGKEGTSAEIPLVKQNRDAQFSGYTFLKCLLQNEKFMEVYKAAWNSFVADGYPRLRAYMEEYANMIEPSAKENGLLWPADYSTSWRLTESSFDFRSNFEALKTWLDERVSYCNSHSTYGLYE